MANKKVFLTELTQSKVMSVEIADKIKRRHETLKEVLGMCYYTKF